jgi:hypothetical protein
MTLKLYHVYSGIFVIDKKFHIIKVLKLAKSRAAGITDDGASTTEIIYGKGEDLINGRCIYARSEGAGT